MNIPIDLIETGPQIRTDIDPEGESIRSLAETIRERGMIQPLRTGQIGVPWGYLFAASGSGRRTDRLMDLVVM